MRHLDVEPRGEVFFFGKTTTPEHQISLLLLLIFFFLFSFWLEKIGKHVRLRNLEKNRFLSWKASTAKDSQKACDLTVFCCFGFSQPASFLLSSSQIYRGSVGSSPHVKTKQQVGL